MSNKIAAFFDMDKTVLSCNSAGRYARYLFKRGELGVRDILKTSVWLLQYRLAMIDAESVSRHAIRSVAGEPESEMVELCLEWFHTDIQQFITRKARAAIQRHREDGHYVVLLTAATPYIAQPVSEHLELDDFLATRLEVSDGIFTGEPVEPLCYGQGKIVWAERWARERDVDLERSFFYSDSYTDKPMLERVGNPIAVNPDPRLKRYARRQTIPIEYWN